MQGNQAVYVWLCLYQSDGTIVTVDIEWKTMNLRYLVKMRIPPQSKPVFDFKDDSFLIVGPFFTRRQ